MWKWLHRRRARHRAENASTIEPTTSDAPSSSEGSARLQSLFFKPSVPISAIPPKCLRRVTFSDILYGGRIEDFSPECWLEDHLHHFGLPTNQSQFVLQSSTNEGISSRGGVIEDNNDDSSTGSSDSEMFNYSDNDQDSDITLHVTRPRLALEDLFNPLPEFEDDLNSSEYGEIILQNPPPYSEFDLPPSYEEAVGQHERRSCSSRSRSSQGSSLAFMW